MPNIESELEKMRLSATTDGENKDQEVQDSCSINIGLNGTKIDLVLRESSPFYKTDCDKTIAIPSKDPSIAINSDMSMLEQNVPMTEEKDILVSSTASNSVHTDSSDEVKTKRKRRKKVGMKKRSKTKETASVSKNLNALRQSDVLSKEEDLGDKPEEIFQMDDDYAENDDEGFASTGGLSRSISLPVSANLDNLFGSKWTNRKTSSTFTGEFHPFSDGDVTPHSR